MSKCATPYCRNEADKYRKYCPKCRYRQWRDKNPVGAAYHNLKNSARRRHKEFTLTQKQFKEFCERTNYIELKGTSAECASIDRIDPNRGYTIDNIRVLSLSDNVKRRFEEDEEECPF